MIVGKIMHQKGGEQMKIGEVLTEGNLNVHHNAIIRLNYLSKRLWLNGGLVVPYGENTFRISEIRQVGIVDDNPLMMIDLVFLKNKSRLMPFQTKKIYTKGICYFLWMDRYDNVYLELLDEINI